MLTFQDQRIYKSALPLLMWTVSTHKAPRGWIRKSHFHRAPFLTGATHQTSTRTPKPVQGNLECLSTSRTCSLAVSTEKDVSFFMWGTSSVQCWYLSGLVYYFSDMKSFHNALSLHGAWMLLNRWKIIHAIISWFSNQHKVCKCTIIIISAFLSNEALVITQT